MQVRDARVVAEGARRPERERPEDGGSQQQERQPLRPERRSTVDDERCGDECDRQDHVLHARERGAEREPEEQQLAPPGRTVERGDARRDGTEDERVGDRVGERVGGVEEIGDRDREHGAGERVARAERKPAREQVHGHRRERHQERVLDLRQPKGDLGGGERLQGRCEERLEQRREVRRRPADGRRVPGPERAGDRRVEVLVREVRRRGMGCRRDDAHGERRRDDQRQADRCSQPARERQRPLEGGQGGGHGHSAGIGSPVVRLDPGPFRPATRPRSAPRRAAGLRRRSRPGKSRRRRPCRR